MSEHQIISPLHEIVMVANAYKIKTNNFDHHAAYKSYFFCFSLLYKIHIFCSNFKVKLDKILGLFLIHWKVWKTIEINKTICKIWINHTKNRVRNIRACLVAIFENCSGKQFLRIVFCVFRKKIVFGNWILENNFCFQKNKKKHV